LVIHFAQIYLSHLGQINCLTLGFIIDHQHSSDLEQFHEIRLHMANLGHPHFPNYLVILQLTKPKPQNFKMTTYFHFLKNETFHDSQPPLRFDQEHYRYSDLIEPDSDLSRYNSELSHHQDLQFEYGTLAYFRHRQGYHHFNFAFECFPHFPDSGLTDFLARHRCFNSLHLDILDSAEYLEDRCLRRDQVA
jgi:hypothetical protein